MGADTSDRERFNLRHLHTLPASHSISRRSLQSCIEFKSPLQRISNEIKRVYVERLDKIEQYIIALWEHRIEYEDHTHNDSPPKQLFHNLGSVSHHQMRELSIKR